MSDYDGRVALITGGATGIGRATARLLAAQGCAVAICSNDVAATYSAADEIAEDGGHAMAVPADVTSPDAMDLTVQRVVDTWGRLDILIASAGIQRYGTTTDTSEEAWDEVFEVNVKGVFLAARAALPHLRERRGAIVVVSSVQASVAQTAVVAYATSKGALNAMVRAMAVDEAPQESGSTPSVPGRSTPRCYGGGPRSPRTAARRRSTRS